MEPVSIEHGGDETVGEVHLPDRGDPAPAVLVAHGALGLRSDRPGSPWRSPGLTAA
jgi:hypothetical protein